MKAKDEFFSDPSFSQPANIFLIFVVHVCVIRLLTPRPWLLVLPLCSLMLALCVCAAADAAAAAAAAAAASQRTRC
jgi:uncharacterized membrane protein YccC